MSPEFECFDMALAGGLCNMTSSSGDQGLPHAGRLNSLIEALVGHLGAYQKGIDTEGSLLR